jgi:protein-disulfide isomerase
MAYPVVKAVEREFAGTLRFVFRNFPLPQHPHAYPAAETSEFAADHDRFWEMHEMLFEHQRALDLPHLLTYAQELGLDPDALLAALRAGTYRSLIEEVRLGGIESGVEGTPTFFINDTLFVGQPSFEAFSDAVHWHMKHRAPL